MFDSQITTVLLNKSGIQMVSKTKQFYDRTVNVGRGLLRGAVQGAERGV